jgi:purine-binding chemotaxis protein CheW
MSTGFVLFRLGSRRFAAALDDVREIVRLHGLEPLPGATDPLAGMIVLRGEPLPMVDIRASDRVANEERGDVLVVVPDGEPVGIAVDTVIAVLHPDELPPGPAAAKALPAYVVGVGQGSAGPVLIVDLYRLLDSTAPGWNASLVATAQT